MSHGFDLTRVVHAQRGARASSARRTTSSTRTTSRTRLIRSRRSTTGRPPAPTRATACRSAPSSRRRGASRSRRSSSIARRLPTLTFEGIDINDDGNVNDITARAYQYTGLNDDGTATFKEIGACENVNCSRRAPFSQLNLRLSKSFRLGGGARIEAIAEVFNLFNAKNPALPLTSQRVSAAGVAQAQLHAAGRVRRRHRSARAAHRPDRVPVLVLRTLRGLRGHSTGTLKVECPRTSANR